MSSIIFVLPTKQRSRGEFVLVAPPGHIADEPIFQACPRASCRVLTIAYLLLRVRRATVLLHGRLRRSVYTVKKQMLRRGVHAVCYARKGSTLRHVGHQNTHMRSCFVPSPHSIDFMIAELARQTHTVLDVISLPAPVVPAGRVSSAFITERRSLCVEERPSAALSLSPCAFRLVVPLQSRAVT